MGGRVLETGGLWDNKKDEWDKNTLNKPRGVEGDGGRDGTDYIRQRKRGRQHMVPFAEILV